MRAGHPWVYRGDLLEVQGCHGDMVDLVFHGSMIGVGVYGPSDIAVRVISHRHEDPWEALRREIRSAFDLRRRLMPAEDALRLLHGESDRLPAVVADLYGSTLVLQLSHLGWVRSLDLLTRVLLEAAECSGFKVLNVILKNTGKHLFREGLSEEVRAVVGVVPEDLVVRFGSIDQRVDVLEGQKTGLYLDTRLWAGELAQLPVEGGEVLDAFSYQGHLSLHCLVRGASRAVMLEQSGGAIRRALWAAHALGVSHRVEAIEGNAFDEMRRLALGGLKFRAVAVDPPPFAPSRRNLQGALRGYKELLVRALDLVETGGFVLFGSCSHAVTFEHLVDLIRQAASDRRAHVRILRRLCQPPDHPVDPRIPQGEYLRGIIMEVRKS